MSFLKIKDPVKRDAIVKEYLDLKNNTRSNLLSERTGEMETKKELSKIFSPITETQEATAKEIKEELIPIKEGIEKIPKAIPFPSYPFLEMSKEDIMELGPIAGDALLIAYGDPDKDFGLHVKNRKFHIGKYPVIIKDNNIIIEGVTYPGTKGLWELLTLNKPDPGKFTNVDMSNYREILLQTNAMYRNDDPTQNRPKGNYRGYKWENIISIFWEEEKERKAFESGKPLKKTKKTKGKGVIVIPEDPDALLERLDLLLSSQNAGHTGVGNELVSICDELRRQGVIDDNTYKKLNSIIKK